MRNLRDVDADRFDPGSPTTTVWLVEDNELYRQTIAEVIDEQPDLECPVAVATCEEALGELDNDRIPDIALMDIGLPGINGIEGARLLLERSPASRVIMLTVHDERDVVFEAIAAGATGYLLKSSSSDALLRAVRQVIAGGAPINAHIARKVLEVFADRRKPEADYGLTKREAEILELMVEGLKMRQIADRLFVSFHTIDTHIRNIYAKLHVRSRSRAVAKALKERLV